MTENPQRENTETKSQTPEISGNCTAHCSAPSSVEQFLHEMAVLAARLVSGGLSCGMTMQPSGRPVTVACSDQVASRVDEVQYELDDGPCLHAMRDGHVVRIEDTTEKARWPEFEAQAASHGDPVVPGPAAERGWQAGRRPQPVFAPGLGVRHRRGASGREFRGKRLRRAFAGHEAGLARRAHRPVAFIPDFANGH